MGGGFWALRIAADKTPKATKCVRILAYPPGMIIGVLVGGEKGCGHSSPFLTLWAVGRLLVALLELPDQACRSAARRRNRRTREQAGEVDHVESIGQIADVHLEPHTALLRL